MFHTSWSTAYADREITIRARCERSGSQSSGDDEAMWGFVIILVLVSPSLWLLLERSVANAMTEAPYEYRILVYSATREYRHESASTAIEALTHRGSSINARFDSTEDESRFTYDHLCKYDAILFLSNSGEGMQIITVRQSGLQVHVSSTPQYSMSQERLR